MLYLFGGVIIVRHVVVLGRHETMYTTGPKWIGSLFGKLGPGLLLAATAIGVSHLVMSPQAGSMFGFQLLYAGSKLKIIK